MASYKLSEDAKDDLIRIHQYGVRTFGEAQADQYYFGLFERLEKIVKNPYQYPEVDERRGYRKSVYGVDTIYYRMDGETVVVVRVLGRQDVDKNL